MAKFLFQSTFKHKGTRKPSIDLFSFLPMTWQVIIQNCPNLWLMIGYPQHKFYMSSISHIYDNNLRKHWWFWWYANENKFEWKLSSSKKNWLLQKSRHSEVAIQAMDVHKLEFPLPVYTYIEARTFRKSELTLHILAKVSSFKIHLNFITRVPASFRLS